MTIITIITLFGTLGGGGELTDLCDLTHPDTGTPLFCQPHHEDAPAWDDTVCCKSGNCVPTNTDGTCPEYHKPYYCELGEQWADDSVSCYFVVPDYCDVFPCEPGYSAFPQANGMCCYYGECYHMWSFADECETSDIFWCHDGVSNQDGTVTCFD